MFVEFPADGRVDETVVVHLVGGACAVGVLAGADEHAADVQIELLDGIPCGVEADLVIWNETNEMISFGVICVDASSMLPCVGKTESEFVDGTCVEAGFDAADFHLVNICRICSLFFGIITAV